MAICESVNAILKKSEIKNFTSCEIQNLAVKTMWTAKKGSRQIILTVLKTQFKDTRELLLVKVEEWQNLCLNNSKVSENM